MRETQTAEDARSKEVSAKPDEESRQDWPPEVEVALELMRLANEAKQRRSVIWPRRRSLIIRQS